MSLFLSLTVRIAGALTLLGVAAGAAAQTPAEPDRLFQNHDLLEIRIVGPITTLTRKRPDDEDLPATATWTDSDGRTVEVSVGLRTRGNYRRDRKNCTFPPVRLNFKSSEVVDTLFEKQDKLKLVSNCKKSSSRYEQAVLREYLSYRFLNVLTDVSYRVRLLRVTFDDTESKRSHDSYAFAIEHKDRFSKRTNLPIVEIPGTTPSQLNPVFANLMSVFGFLMGNTDFSQIAGAEGENCCHNVNLYGGEATGLFPVPYDFDITGMVNAPYASPNPRFNLRSVRHRLYRGRCINNQHLPASLEKFAQAKNTLYALVENQEQLSSSSRKNMRSYLNSFFKIIEDPKAFDKKITQACSGTRLR